MKYSVIKFAGFGDHKQTPILRFLKNNPLKMPSHSLHCDTKNMKDVPNVLKSIYSKLLGILQTTSRLINSVYTFKLLPILFCLPTTERGIKISNCNCEFV